MADENPENEQEVAGNGKFFFPNSGTYDGDYKEWVVAEEDAEEAGEEAEAKPPPRRVRHGKGTYSERGNTYTGEWEDDKMHGKGKFTYASKTEYDGDWVANQYQGTGKYTWPDGSSYEGSWEENTLHGDGIYTDAEGHRFKGDFFNGKGNNLVKLL